MDAAVLVSQMCCSIDPKSSSLLRQEEAVSERGDRSISSGEEWRRIDGAFCSHLVSLEDGRIAGSPSDSVAVSQGLQLASHTPSRVACRLTSYSSRAGPWTNTAGKIRH